MVPGALAMVSCQLLTFKNVYSHSSESQSPLRKASPQSSSTSVLQSQKLNHLLAGSAKSCSLARNFPLSTGLQPAGWPALQASWLQDSELWGSRFPQEKEQPLKARGWYCAVSYCFPRKGGIWTSEKMIRPGFASMRTVPASSP